MINRIGLFDSGVGGLTVLKALSARFPHLTYVYYADTAHAPYGDKPIAELYGYNQHIVQTLIAEKCDMLVFACNTSIALFYPEFRKTVTLPMAEIITPGARSALKVSPSKRIGVLATTRTCNSHVYRDTILASDPHAQVIEWACPELVPLIESGQIEKPEHLATLVAPLRHLEAQGVDTVIYGCSHYPFLEKIWTKAAPNLNFVNPAEALAEQLIPELGSSITEEPGLMTFMDSGDSKIFKQLVGQLFKKHPYTLKQAAFSINS